jgi:hypothetical protein
VDSGSPRTLGGVSVKLSNNSPQACADLCGRFGFQYAGVEYGRYNLPETRALNQSQYLLTLRKKGMLLRK